MNSGKRKLIDILRNKYDAIIQGNMTWYQISCPFCGDSPNPKSRHCNIRVSEHDDIVIVHCFQLKCTASGVMNKSHLRKMGIYDKDITSFIENNYSSSKEIISKTYDININWKGCTTVSENIAKYFYARTNKDLTPERILKYRIVPNIREFYNINLSEFNEDIRNRFLKLGNMIDDFIGFLNENGTSLEIRNINPDVSKDKRFMKINLSTDDRLIFMKPKPYVIKRNFDYIKSNDKHSMIVMTEGKFDCINAMEHFIPDIAADAIFISATIGGFKSLIYEYSKIYPYRDLVIFADRDVMDNTIIRMIKPIEYRFNKLYVIRNEAGKDLGDFRDKIEPVKYELELKKTH